MFYLVLRRVLTLPLVRIELADWWSSGCQVEQSKTYQNSFCRCDLRASSAVATQRSLTCQPSGKHSRKKTV